MLEMVDYIRTNISGKGKKNGTSIIAYIVCFVVGAAIGFCWGFFDKGTSVSEVREKLNSVKSVQQSITSSIRPITEQVQGTGTVIDDCLSIIREVRQNPAPQNK